MKQALTAFSLLVIFIASCRKEVQITDDQPVQWDNEWACFTAIMEGSWDTLEIGFSSNQNAYCSGYEITTLSMMPNGSEARYISKIANQYYEVEIKRGILNFTAPTMSQFEVPDSLLFVDYFRSGYDSLTDDLDYTPGVEIQVQFPNGDIFRSGDGANWGNTNYTCRITDYHPFSANGVDYVKVKMFFDNIRIANQSNDWRILRNCEYEGYFKND